MRRKNQEREVKLKDEEEKEDVAGAFLVYQTFSQIVFLGPGELFKTVMVTPGF